MKKGNILYFYYAFGFIGLLMLISGLLSLQQVGNGHSAHSQYGSKVFKTQIIRIHRGDMPPTINRRGVSAEESQSRLIVESSSTTSNLRRPPARPEVVVTQVSHKHVSMPTYEQQSDGCASYIAISVGNLQHSTLPPERAWQF